MSADWMDTKTRFRRARSGDTIHMDGCNRAKNTIPWLFAEDKTDDEVFAWVARSPWLHLCKICKPLGVSVGKDQQQ